MGYALVMTREREPSPNDGVPASSEAIGEQQQPQAAVRRSREPIFNIPAVVIALVAICAGIHLIRVYLLTPEQDFDLLVRAAFIPIRYSGEFDVDIWAFTTPVTYAFLHGNFPHLILNMVWFLAFGTPLANRLGAPRFLLFWIATSLGAVALHYIAYPDGQSPLVGASGAISGMMGAAARFGFAIDRSSGRGVFGGPLLSIRAALTSRSVVTFLAVWFAINLVTGLVGFAPGMEDASIAWEAHIGGFLTGFLGIGLFDRRSPPTARRNAPPAI
jgi:membrane associated rhomboid family serine protease